MQLSCPNCHRLLTNSDDPDNRPQFCMYCGQRLQQDSPGADSQQVTADVATQSYTPAGDFDPPPHAPPERIGGLKLVRFIGAGGMGAVYEAVAEESGQRVAVKLLSPRLMANRVSVERFRQEGRVASQINHPRCVFVLRADADAGRPFIVMELMPGKTLKDLVDQNGPLNPQEAIQRILDVIDGLREAHRLGVIHRDVKPSNCFLTADNRVKVGDFGLSKSLAVSPEGAQQQLTQSGAFLGTILFASPEQIRGEPVGYDSDVYAVCATLYFLLTGRAPHQHESVTATVAKAISDPVAPIRSFRPKIPAELDRIVLRGLERDRDRRYQTLDDLREALETLLPANQRPASPRALVLAYLIDVLLLQIPVILVDLLPRILIGTPSALAKSAVTFTDLVIALLYFAPLEGLFGATLGKRLLGLRVTRQGETSPPGLGHALLRTLAFHLVLFSTLIGLGWIIYPPGPRLPLRLAGVIALVSGVSVLAWQLRSESFRGIHDLLTGCRTVQRPRPVRRKRLLSRYPNPLNRIQPSLIPLPREVGGFVVRGKLADLPDGGQVWVAQDQELGRRVLIRLFPPGKPVPTASEPPTARPTRLRHLGHGLTMWNGHEQAWLAVVAPAGAPLVDVVTPHEPLNWADTRPLLEQLTEEFLAADADGTTIPELTVSQLWVEPGGRLQIVDFPLPTGCRRDATLRLGEHERRVTEPLQLIRLVTTLALEGQPRSSGGPVRAPIPPHAAKVTSRLFRDDAEGYLSLTSLQTDLAETHTHPAQITTAMRTAYLSVLGMMLTPGLILMLLMTGLLSFALSVLAAAQVWAPSQILDTISDQARRNLLLQEIEQLPSDNPLRQRLQQALAPERVDTTTARLKEWLELRNQNLVRHLGHLTSFEQSLVKRLQEIVVGEQPEKPSPRLLENASLYIQLSAGRVDEKPLDIRHAMTTTAIAVILVVPLFWAGFALIFRGGLAMTLAGLTLVLADGRPAERWRCALRELVIWSPLMLLLLISVWIQAAAPEYAVLRALLWFAAIAVLPIQLLIAVRWPDRTPHDRLLQTHLVPI